MAINTLPNNQWLRKEIKDEIQIIWKQKNFQIQISKLIGCIKSQSKRDLHSNKYPQRNKKYRK